MLSLHRLAGDILNTAEAFLNSNSKSKSKPALFCLLKMSRPHSKMALSKRWKTASLFSRVVTRSEGTATRRHFAAITLAPETRPSRFSDSAQLKKRRIPKEVRLNLLWASLGGEPTVLTLKAPADRPNPL